MPRVKKAPKAAKPNEGWQDRLHLVEFSYEDEDAIAGWYSKSSPDPFACLSELVDNHWSVRVTPPSSGDDYWVSCTYKAPGEAYSEHTFTVKYPDLEDGLCLAYYVCNHLVKDGQMDALVRPKSRKWLNNQT